MTLRLLPGGRPRLSPGDRVLVDGSRPATVVCASFSTFVFRDDVSIVYEDDASRDMVPLGRVALPPPGLALR